MTGHVSSQAPLAVVAPVHPLVSGAAQFNTAMVCALSDLGPVQAISWRRLYPPIIHRRGTHDLVSRPSRVPPADAVLDWADPRSWRKALRAIAAAGARAIILPWIHPVMAPPYRYLLRHAPSDVARVVICHNVEPHEPVPAGTLLTRSVLRHADLLVTHASHQRHELARLGVGDRPIVEAFHPHFTADELSATPTREQISAERARQGHPDVSLLAFGAIRPYKGVDLAVEAMARVPCALNARLTIAGVCWDGGEQLRSRIAALGLEQRVELRDGFVSNEDAALLFSAADASLLPYRSATQSGVVALSFAYGVPVIATAVGGLVEAVADGRDGILCPSEDVDALVAAIQRFARERSKLAAGAKRANEMSSFARYGELLRDGIHALSARPGIGRRRPRGWVPRLPGAVQVSS